MGKIYKLSDDPEQEKEAGRYANPLPSRTYILQFLKDAKSPADIHKIATVFQLESAEAMVGLRRRLRAMELAGQIIKNRRGGYGVVDRMDLLKGRVVGHRDGYGFMVVEEGGPDLFLSPYQMKKVMHGDRVLANVTKVDYHGRREGEVVEILEYANVDVVGRLAEENGLYLLIPDNKKITQTIVVDPVSMHGAHVGQIVVVTLHRKQETTRAIVGKIKEVLGDELMPGLEIEMAIRTHALPHQWSTQILDEVKQLAALPIERSHRLDLRSLPFVTIDGEDAKDFDDAIFVQPLPNNQWQLHVAIADVSHYVVPDTALDQEAYVRGTSVYFPGQVIPMLPTILSNDLCSLKPQVDRLCLVAILTIDQDGQLQQWQFHEGIICSKARLTYTLVAEILSDKKSRRMSQYSEILVHLRNAHHLYKVLKKSREVRGAIDFDTVETKFVLGHNRKVQQIIPVVRNDAHKLIEECMIMANVAAANFIAMHELTAPYRIHEAPPANKIDDLNKFLQEFGLAMTRNKKSNAEPKHYMKILQKIKEQPYSHIVQTVLLRSLSQAQYCPKNVGHFGLALPLYTHFTSPIRRYPDLLIHRAIRSILEKERKKDSSSYPYGVKQMAEMSQNCSYTERRADEAVREVELRLKCEYMQDHLGLEFKGIISGVTSFGLFVELYEYYVEGLVHVTSLPNDYYHFDPIKHRLVGERQARVFRLGDQIDVRLIAVNVDTRTIDLELLEMQAQSSRKKSKSNTNKASAKTSKIKSPQQSKKT